MDWRVHHLSRGGSVYSHSADTGVCFPDPALCHRTKHSVSGEDGAWMLRAPIFSLHESYLSRAGSGSNVASGDVLARRSLRRGGRLQGSVRWTSCSVRNDRFHEGSWIRVDDSQVAAEFAGPLAHPTYPYTHTVNLSGRNLPNAFPVVANGDNDTFALLG